MEAGGERLEAFLAQAKALAEAALDRLLPPAEAPPARLHESMRYAVFGGGKRLRPALVLAAAEACGGDPAAALPAAAAFELVHTYSLVHDDLPCMDDDDLRRGRPTVHKAYGEALALLAGDALLTLAFGVVAGEIGRPEAARRVGAVLARAAGSAGMVGGQVLDLEGEGAPPTLEQVRAIHLRKTAALIAGCLEAGAVMAGAAPGACRALARAGELMGLAFQVQDDVLDETADVDTLGKTPGKDRQAGKLTWPACVGLEASRAEAERLAGLAVGELAGAGIREGILPGLVRLMVRRDR